ncbi:MAG: bglK [Acidimicrobiaceae bacterium]|nr:bglK [Acidimicrobiaceae bacterium]
MSRFLRALLAVAAVALLALVGVPAAAAHASPGQLTSASSASPSCPWVDETAPIATKVHQVLSAMNLSDEINMVSGVPGSAYVGEIAAKPSLCLPALTLEDGPAGVGDGLTGVTQLPAPVDAAATWDPTELSQYGQVIGAEDKTKGAAIDLGPTINIVRDPRWGRAFETFGEDPYLNGTMATSEIQGIQSQGTMAQVKHYAVYNQETSRNTPQDNAIVSDRALHEIYLPAFQQALTQGKPSSVMCSYSSINGTYACDDTQLLTDILKNLWGYPGFVTSDWGANHSTVASANAGLDMEMPNPGFWGPQLQVAVQDGQVPKTRLDDMVSRILTEEFRFGIIDHPPTGTASAVATTPAHVATAQKIAEDGTVLLQNTGNVLPLDSSKVRSIAVIGDDAGPDAETAGGGSAGVTASSIVTPYEGISARAGSQAAVTYSQGNVGNNGSLPTVPSSTLSPSSGTGPGLYGQYYNNVTLSGSPVYTSVDPQINSNYNGGSPAPGVNPDQWSVKWTGTITAPTTGTYTFSLTSDDGSRLFVNGQEVINNWSDHASTTVTGTVDLTAGTPANIEVDYYQNGGGSNVTFGWLPPGQSLQSQAVQAAKNANVAVVFANVFESEGSDLTNIDLPASENDLISAVAAANPNTIVVLNTGSAVTMPWLSQVKGVLEAWYPGQQDGTAIASILFGDTNPSGKLPVTFPTSLNQTPTATPQQFPGVNGKSLYSEGLDVGYRYYTSNNIQPLFPFGFGLSYTKFAFSNLQLTGNVMRPGTQETASADVTNTGSVAGSEVAQLYLGDPSSTGEPSERLTGFQKVSLVPGQTQRVTFTVTSQDASYWDSPSQSWVAAPGTYQVMVGDSSENLPLRSHFDIVQSTGPRSTTLSAPETAAAGGSVTVTETYANGSTVPTNSDRQVLNVPNGWTATPTTPATSPSVAAGGTFITTWQVAVPSNATPGSATLTGDTTYIGGQTNEASTSVSVPYASLATAYDNTGIGNDASSADFDGTGYSYNASTLAAAGLSPGTPVSAGGLSFTWPNVPAGQPDNVVTKGQVIDVSGSGNTLGILGAGTNGTQTGNVVVTYTDGSTSTSTLRLADWYANAPDPGTNLVATASNWNYPASSTLGAHAVSLYEQDLPLTPGKTPATMTLPSNSLLHVFAAAIGTTTTPPVYPSLSAAFNNTGVGDNASLANFDGTGYSYNTSALAAAGLTPGATFTAGSLSFTWPDAASGQPDNVVAANQTISVKGSGSTIGFVGSGNNGTQTTPVLVNYTDGTSAVVDVTFADWYADQAASGGSIVASTNWNYPTTSSFGPHQVGLYEASASLDPSKTVASITLGTNGRFHVFALAIGT